MRKLVFNIIAILCIGLFYTPVSGLSTYSKDHEKVIREEFTIAEGGEISIKNSFGNVFINTTGGNEVVIEVTIKVDSKSSEKAEEFFDRINIDFNNTRSTVSAITEIGSQNRSSWTRWLNPNNWNSNNNDFNISYEVWMPSTCKLDLKNKHGNIAVADMDNDIILELKHGNGSIEDVKGNLKLDLGFGEFKMVSVIDAELDIKHSEFKCKSSRDIQCDTKHSDIYIDKVRNLVADTGHDDFFLGDVSTLINEGGHADFEVESLGEFDFDAGHSGLVIGELQFGGIFHGDHSDLSVKKVNGLSKGLDVEGSHTDVSLRIGIPFNIDLKSNYTDIDMPSKMTYTTRIKDGNEEDFQGKSGNTSSNNIKVDMKHGSFEIRGRN